MFLIVVEEIYWRNLISWILDRGKFSTSIFILFMFIHSHEQCWLSVIRFYNILYERLFWTILNAEAVVRTCSSKQMFLNNLQYSQEDTCVEGSFHQSCRPDAFLIVFFITGDYFCKFRLTITLKLWNLERPCFIRSF